MEAMSQLTLADQGGTPRLSRRRRRWPLIGILAVAVLPGVLAIWWFQWVPNWRPPLEEGERYGIDVSAHQDVIDWRQVAGDGITFAYIKATEGGDFTDDQFDENWRGAQDAGLDRGAYHYFTLCTPGAEQAHHFIDVAPPENDALPPAVDLELAGNCSARPGPSEVRGQLGDFIRLVEEAWGREIILYVGDDFERAYPVRHELDRPLWHRRFLLRPDLDGWLIWQLHGYARVDGIDGGVDLDVMRPSPLSRQHDAAS
jgi:lysozyme